MLRFEVLSALVTRRCFLTLNHDGLGDEEKLCWPPEDADKVQAGHLHTFRKLAAEDHPDAVGKGFGGYAQ